MEICLPLVGLNRVLRRGDRINSSTEGPDSGLFILCPAGAPTRGSQEASPEAGEPLPLFGEPIRLGL